jgi:hypothetical protein
MKATVTKEEYTKLPELLQAEYKEEGDKYILKVDGGEDFRKARDHEKEKRKEAEARLKQIEKEKADAEEARRKAEEEAELSKKRKAGDLEAIEKSYQQKLAEKDEAYKAEITKRDEATKSQAVEAAANRLAGSISTSPDLMLPHIKGRLAAELTESGSVVVRVVDKDGKLTSNKVEDLQKEILEDKAFAPIIKGSEARGGGASSQPGSGGASPGSDKKVDFASGNPKEIAAKIKAEREARGE